MFHLSQVSLHLNNEEQCFIHNDIPFFGQQTTIQHDLVWGQITSFTKGKGSLVLSKE